MRDYVDICLKWGVILNGPGDYGPWPECESHLRKDGYPSRKITDLKRFCDEMEEGDLVILRQGTSTVFAVGEILGCYEHHEEFGDVDGWDVSHVRRVRWLWKDTNEPKKFDTYALKFGDTTQRLNSQHVNSWLYSLEISGNAHDPVPLPRVDKSRNVSVQDISEYLFGKGVASSSISNLLREIDEYVRIANWYRREDRREGRPSERETVCYLVVPLLRALGWTPQRMAIEWNQVDVALFSSLPRKDDHLSVVVEAKRMDSSCLSAVSQANRYALEVKHCTRLIVTDGLRYGVFVRENDQDCRIGDFSLYAYMNLRRLRSGYPLYCCKGAQDALLAMAPEWQQVEE